MRILRISLIFLAVLLLTLITQVGGLILLASLFIKYRNKPAWARYLLQGATFLILYIITTLLIIPLIARPFGRVPLPLTKTNGVQPLNIVTCLFNRHYVRPELRTTVQDVARQMNHQFPGTVVNYLDAGFPFFNKFPLVPHLSHHDGKKLDLAFYYTNTQTGLPTNQAPSFIGYGISEGPRANEENTAVQCKANWQYSFMTTVIPQGNKRFYTFDPIRTKALVNQFASAPAIGKLFIEPHLKTRLGITNNKVRFHGCQAVRHDDHLHVQLK